MGNCNDRPALESTSPDILKVSLKPPEVTQDTVSSPAASTDTAPDPVLAKEISRRIDQQLMADLERQERTTKLLFLGKLTP